MRHSGIVEISGQTSDDAITLGSRAAFFAATEGERQISKYYDPE